MLWQPVPTVQGSPLQTQFSFKVSRHGRQNASFKVMLSMLCVQDLASAAPAPATQIQSAKRRQLLQVQPLCCIDGFISVAALLL